MVLISGLESKVATRNGPPSSLPDILAHPTTYLVYCHQARHERGRLAGIHDFTKPDGQNTSTRFVIAADHWSTASIIGVMTALNMISVLGVIRRATGFICPMMVTTGLRLGLSLRNLRAPRKLLIRKVVRMKMLSLVLVWVQRVGRGAQRMILR
ncbi:hypothetical protein BDV12DRAFT_176724 [Aspergillus spectabilis]